MNEAEKISAELKKIETAFKERFSRILNERDQKIAAVLKKQDKEKHEELSSSLSS